LVPGSLQQTVPSCSLNHHSRIPVMKGKEAGAFAGIPMKWISLVLLVLQTVAVILMMRYSRTRHQEGQRYLSTTAVFYAEVMKALFSLAFLRRENKDFKNTITLITRSFNWADAVRMCVPSLLYSLQNNLLFIALSNLSAAVYQVTHQMKILTTAFFSITILGTSLGLVKWLSLLVLTMGVALIQLPRNQSSGEAPAQGSAFVGFVAVFGGCMTSGLGGVYLEKILKQSQLSIWMRNIQLALSGSVFALATVTIQDYEAVRANGFHQGYDWFVWAVIFVHSIGGLIVALCMKYADNILKCFGNAIAIIINCILSHILLSEFELDVQFFMGTLLVIASTTVYNLGLPSPLLRYIHRRGREKYDDFDV